MGSSALSRNASVDDPLSAISTILACQEEGPERIRYVLSEEPEPPFPIDSTRTPTDFSEYAGSSVLSSLDSSQFLETVPDSYAPGRGTGLAFSSALSVPESSPPLLASRTPFAPPGTRVISVYSDATESNSISTVRDTSIQSFIHFHGKTARSDSARRWTCNYCKFISWYTGFPFAIICGIRVRGVLLNAK